MFLLTSKADFNTRQKLRWLLRKTANQFLLTSSVGTQAAKPACDMFDLSNVSFERLDAITWQHAGERLPVAMQLAQRSTLTQTSPVLILSLCIELAAAEPLALDGYGADLAAPPGSEFLEGLAGLGFGSLPHNGLHL